MPRALAALAVFASVLTAAVPEARACSCVQPPPPLDALAQATAVFEARVGRVETDTARLRSTAHLFVLRVWKGDVPEDVTVTTASQGSLCGFPFRPDQRVLLYADGEPATLSVSMCSRSRPVEQASEDLAVLLDLPVSPPRGAATTTGSGAGGTSAPPPANAPPPGGATPAPRPAPRTGGCGGCGGASAAGLPVVIAAAFSRRRR